MLPLVVFGLPLPLAVATLVVASVVALALALISRPWVVQSVWGGLFGKEPDTAQVRALLSSLEPSPSSLSRSSSPPRLPFEAIGLRVDEDERAVLGVGLHALRVVDYATACYHLPPSNPLVRSHIQEFFRLVVALRCASDFRSAPKLTAKRLSQHSELVGGVCEVLRRHVGLRLTSLSSHAALVALLQDAAHVFGFDCFTDITTVASFLEEKDGDALLNDPALSVATQPIERDAQQAEKKREALAHLVATHSSPLLSQEEVERVVASVGDYRAFLHSNQTPVRQMIDYLVTWFDADKDAPDSLAITRGHGTARLTHSHKQQFVFVLQSLVLWNEVMAQMAVLVRHAHADLLDPRNSYRVRDTGQGVHRVQRCPQLRKAMQALVARVQQQCGGWVGLDVVHLSDDAVPNALVFIHKYAAVPAILRPILRTLSHVDALVEDKDLAALIARQFGDVRGLQRAILVDFFKHAFDGSGSDGGSCIDGRLTSAWNWCSRIERKEFYPFFLLTGFTGFDPPSLD